MKETEKLQAWWACKQGLDGSLAGRTAHEVLDRTGWARSVGGAGPYLTLFSRAGITREAADAAAAKLDIHELPSARGCTYVVPAADFALALRAGHGFNDGDMRTAAKLGVTAAEIDRLCLKVIDALSGGPKDPEAIREAAGGAVRNLGEAGKKKGLTTTLPVAIGKLQSAGEIRRVPVHGRLDQQRYRYALWSPNPLTLFRLSQDEVYVELARRYFRWIGPATPDEFRWFSGLGVRASKEALEPLKLAALPGSDNRLMFAEDLDAFRSFQRPKKPHYVLVSCLDGMTLLRRDVKGVLAPEDAKRKVFCEKSHRAASELSDLPSHGLFDRGRLVGLWEFDPGTQSIAWSSFIARDKALAEAVKATEMFVRDQLGDARSFSLDSPKSRAPRIEALRKAG